MMCCMTGKNVGSQLATEVIGGSAHFTLQKPRWYQHLCAELFWGHEVVTGQGSELAVQLNRTRAI